MNQRTRKLTTMHKALHYTDDVDRLYASRMKGGRELGSIEDSVDASIQRLGDYIEKHIGLITAMKNDTDNPMTNSMTISRKQKWYGNQSYGRFKRLISNISKEKPWTCLRKGNFKRETESLLIVAQNNIIRTNQIKAKIDYTKENIKCTLCGDRDETINHRISECYKLAQNEYKTRHDFVGTVINWEMCKKFHFELTNKWYMHKPASVPEKDIL